MNSVCNRCPAWAHCALNPGGKACLRHAAEHDFDARPTRYDQIVGMSVDEMARDLVPMIEELCEDGVPCPEYIKSWLLRIAEED